MQGGAGFYITVEKEGEAESGMLTIAHQNNVPTAKAMLEQRVPKNTPITKGKFAGFDAQIAQYQSKQMDVVTTKTAYAFEACGKKYLISLLSEMRDSATNKQGFQTLANSWKCQ